MQEVDATDMGMLLDQLAVKSRSEAPAEKFIDDVM